MSTGVSDHQRSKGQGNSSKIYNKFPNGPKDHHGADHDDVDSWRNQQQQHHQGYASSMATASDPYMPNYYGASFQYPAAFTNVGDGGPWSSNGGDMTFLSGGYSAGMHESANAGHYNIEGMFGGGNGGTFGNFGGQPGPAGFGYGFHGNGDYNTWGQPQPRKHYDDYYRDNMYGDDRGVKMVEQSMGGLSLSNEKDHGGLKDLKELSGGGGGGGGKKTTWASIASQPAKPQSQMKKKPGMPPPPIIPGTWENKNGAVAKAPIAAPVQAPHPPAWERPKIPPPTAAPPQPPPSQGPPPGPMQGGGPGRGYPPPQMGYMPSQPHPPPPAPMQQHNHSHSQVQPQMNHSAPAPPTQPPQPKYPDELKIKHEYNPTEFDMQAEGARFFVIKSYSEDDIHRSIKYAIWCSTEHGNNRLDQAFREREGKGPLYLFFSVNSSGHFCGMAQMMSAVDYDASSSVWSQDKWKGQFKVKWTYVKDVPNQVLRQIKLENNENKPVTNSRDTQEVPFEKGKQVLKIFHTFQHATSIFDDFIHYEERQKEEDQRRTVQPVPQHEPHDRGMRNDRGGGGGGERGGGERGGGERGGGDRGGGDRGGGIGGGGHSGGRGGYHHGDRGGHGGGGPPHQNHHRDRDMNNHRDNPRDARDHRDRDGHGRMDRNDHRGPPDRDHYGGGGRSFDRDFHPRDREYRGGGRGARGPPRN